MFSDTGRFESMSMYSMGSEFADVGVNPKLSDNELAMQCTIPMGVTSENVAERYGISREQQDHLAMLSHQKYVAIFVSCREMCCIIMILFVIAFILLIPHTATAV